MTNARPIPTPHAPRVRGLTRLSPVLFLDFDGVVHPYNPLAVESSGGNQSKLAAFCWLPLLIDALAEHPAVRIVVTSDWRHFSDDGKLRDHLGALAPRFAGTTGLTMGFTRADYIREVVELNALDFWCALDDDASVRKAAVEEGRFIGCDSAIGISEPRVQVAIAKWLSRVPR